MLFFDTGLSAALNWQLSPCIRCGSRYLWICATAWFIRTDSSSASKGTRPAAVIVKGNVLVVRYKSVAKYDDGNDEGGALPLVPFPVVYSPFQTRPLCRHV